ncbi:hypothetical protein INO35_14175, partial [Staphylococcus aureus]|nr:hypothetical protein [Staphylococcus aureus]
ELVTVQDEQLDSFEETILTFKNKEKQFLEDIKTKQNEIEKVRNEMREAKKLYNEEKSLRILAESKGKTFESVQDNVKEELKLLSDRVHDK